MDGRFDSGFLTITDVRVVQGTMQCRFENGDEASMSVSDLVPRGRRQPRWKAVRIDPGGLVLTVPALPTPFQIPSDVIRSRTHKAFAAYMEAK